MSPTSLRRLLSFFFFFNDTATTEIYTLSLHDALPISCFENSVRATGTTETDSTAGPRPYRAASVRSSSTPSFTPGTRTRSEEHTSELQSRSDLVCRLLLEKKKKKRTHRPRLT